MNDNEKRGEQWQPLVADYLVPRFRGKPKAWKQANMEVLHLIIEKVNQLIATKANMSYKDYQDYEDKIWIEHMFDAVEINRPPKQDYASICRGVEAWVTPQIRSAIPGIIPAIKTLKNHGYMLYTASGESSTLLFGYLTGMNILELFTTLYGPDLVGVMKGGLEYYQKIFAHAQVDPEQVILIDDKPELLQLAGQLGARVIQSCVLDSQVDPEMEYYYHDPRKLPQLIQSILS